MRRLFLLGAATAALLMLPPASGQAATAPAGLRDVVLVGNSVAGSVSFLDGHTFANLGSVNVIPDLAQRLAAMNPIERAAYALVRQQEGGDRFADDVYLSPDGRTLYVSRGNLDDVVAFDLASRTMRWRHQVAGFKADHAALSPDGTRLVVSATTVAKMEVLDTATGALVASVPTGAYPHANDYSADGTRIYNSSIGITALPRVLDFAKGDKLVTVIDAHTFAVLRTYRFAEGVRPAVFTPDGTTMYAQFSYLNGFVEYNLATGRITRTVQMPFSPAGQALSPDSYPNNSAHHGMALSGDTTRLCDVGTIDDYTAVIARPGLSTVGTVTYPTGTLPYWATTSVDGRFCLVSLSNANAVSVVDYTTATEVARVPVGAFPQRERLARVAPDVLPTLLPT
jgi:DNA-binding beta-propeller fold protein YncE